MSTIASTTSKRRALAVLGMMLVLLPLFLWSTRAALKSNSNDPQQWLPRHFDEATTYRWLQQHFGQDEITIVSWPGCTLDDPDGKIEKLVNALTSPDGKHYYQRGMTGPQLVDQLKKDLISLTNKQIQDRLGGLLIGKDGKTTCLILYLSKTGEKERKDAIAHLLKTAESLGLDPDEVRLAGPTVDAATIDVESQRLLLPLAGLSGLIALMLLWWRLKCIRTAFVIFLGAVYSTAVALSILYLTGGHMNLVMTMLPPLIYVLSISSAVHLVNYYRDAVEVVGAESAPRRMVALGWWPCLLAACTTAIGLLSLGVSEIVPVKMFGIYAAVGTVSGLLILLLYLPAILTIWPLPLPKVDPKKAAEEEASMPADGNGKARFARFVMRRHVIITPVCLVLMVWCAWGLGFLKSTVRLQYRFGEDSRIIRDYRWMEEKIGSLIPLEVVVGFTPDCKLDFYDRMQEVQRMEETLAKVENVGTTLSAADFTPLPPSGSQFKKATWTARIRNELPNHRDIYEEAHLLAKEESGNELWRISVRADAFGDVDYGRFTDELRKVVNPEIAGRNDIEVTYTGAIPLIYKAQRELLNDLMESFLWAFAIITIVMCFVLRSPIAAIISMLPNIFPVVVVFGLMGWLNVAIEIGTIMTASAALGIAVDDTLHYLTWFRRGTYAGRSRLDSLTFAYGHCAKAMMHTTLICAFGLLVFTLSSFLPIVRFALLMATLLVVALFGDLVFLPSMLAGWVGRFFEYRPKAGKGDGSESSTDESEATEDIATDSLI